MFKNFKTLLVDIFTFEMFLLTAKFLLMAHAYVEHYYNREAPI